MLLSSKCQWSWNFSSSKLWLFDFVLCLSLSHNHHKSWWKLCSKSKQKTCKNLNKNSKILNLEKASFSQTNLEFMTSLHDSSRKNCAIKFFLSFSVNKLTFFPIKTKKMVKNNPSIHFKTVQWSGIQEQHEHCQFFLAAVKSWNGFDRKAMFSFYDEKWWFFPLLSLLNHFGLGFFNMIHQSDRKNKPKSSIFEKKIFFVDNRFF